VKIKVPSGAIFAIVSRLVVCWVPLQSYRCASCGRFPSQLDALWSKGFGQLLDDRVPRNSKISCSLFSRSHPNRVCPQNWATIRTRDRSNLFPARMFLAIANTAPRILGWQGRTRVPCFDTPSLNPGLWSPLVSSDCGPPSSEKMRTAVMQTIELDSGTIKGPRVFGLSCMYGDTRLPDVASITEAEF
jgi:hypothetical protein